MTEKQPREFLIRVDEKKNKRTTISAFFDPEKTSGITQKKVIETLYASGKVKDTNTETKHFPDQRLVSHQHNSVMRYSITGGGEKWDGPS